MKNNIGGATPEIARMKGVRFIIASEPDKRHELSEAQLKLLTGGDTIAARFLYKDIMQFKPTGKIFFLTNHLPKVADTSHAMWRRIKRIPFNVTISPEKRDNRLAEKLETELPGILNWAVDGCLKWQDDGLKEPKEVTNATEYYKSEMNPVQPFIDEICVYYDWAKVRSSNLYNAYKEWCGAERAGEHILTQKAFSLALEEKGFLKIREGSGQYWQKIGIKDEREK